MWARVEAGVAQGHKWNGDCSVVTALATSDTNAPPDTGFDSFNSTAVSSFLLVNFSHISLKMTDPQNFFQTFLPLHPKPKTTILYPNTFHSSYLPSLISLKHHVEHVYVESKGTRNISPGPMIFGELCGHLFTPPSEIDPGFNSRSSSSILPLHLFSFLTFHSTVLHTKATDFIANIITV